MGIQGKPTEEERAEVLEELRLWKKAGATLQQNLDLDPVAKKRLYMRAWRFRNPGKDREYARKSRLRGKEIPK